MLTTTQNFGQTSEVISYKGSAPISGGTYSAIVYDSISSNAPAMFTPFENLERINSRTTFLFFTPLIKKETEISQTTNLIFQIAKKDKESISNKLQNKYYRLLFYTIAVNLKEIPDLYQDYYIKVHLERDIEIKNWEETVFSIIVPNMDLNDKIELWEKIEKIIDSKVKEIKSNNIDKLRGSFTIEVD